MYRATALGRCAVAGDCGDLIVAGRDADHSERFPVGRGLLGPQSVRPIGRPIITTTRGLVLCRRCVPSAARLAWFPERHPRRANRAGVAGSCTACRVTTSTAIAATARIRTRPAGR